MADENETVTEPKVPETNPTEERIRDLSGKVKTTAEERDAALAKADEATRRANFADAFVDLVATNPAAKEFKADIQAKVLAGYTPEDAAFAVLGKAGKLGTPPPAPASPAGGSASTTMPQGGPKPVGEMSLSEKRAELEKEITWS